MKGRGFSRAAAIPSKLSSRATRDVSSANGARAEGSAFEAYTQGMKQIVLRIPNGPYEQAERLAQQTKKSRSRLFSDALREYLAHHAPDDVTEAMNRACAEVGDAHDPFVSAAARRILERSAW